jgi:hypothetical protein
MTSPDAMSVSYDEDGSINIGGDYTPPEEEPALYADGEWPCQTMVACGCCGIIDCPFF